MTPTISEHASISPVSCQRDVPPNSANRYNVTEAALLGSTFFDLNSEYFVTMTNKSDTKRNRS
jgi:hypothetical protein